MIAGPSLLTANGATENSEADWLEISEKSASPAASRQQPRRGNRASGAGLTTVETAIQRQYDVQTIGRIEAERKRCYAITARRKLKPHAVTAWYDAVPCPLKTAFG